MHFARLVKQASFDWVLATYLSFGVYTGLYMSSLFLVTRIIFILTGDVTEH